MKRIQSACIMQTIAFRQKDGSGLSRETMLKMNREELLRYKTQLDRNRTRYKIDEEADQSDGSVIVRIRKEYSGTADVGSYLD